MTEQYVALFVYSFRPTYCSHPQRDAQGRGSAHSRFRHLQGGKAQGARGPQSGDRRDDQHPGLARAQVQPLQGPEGTAELADPLHVFGSVSGAPRLKRRALCRCAIEVHVASVRWSPVHPVPRAVSSGVKRQYSRQRAVAIALRSPRSARARHAAAHLVRRPLRGSMGEQVPGG